MGYKGDFLSGSTKDFKYGHPTARKKIRSIGRQLQERAAARIGIGEYLHGIGVDQRQWADRNIRPIERGLSENIQSRLGDQTALMADAQQGTMDAYDRSAIGAVRNAARYGVTLDDPSLDRGFQLDRTRAAIESGDLAARTDRDNALAEADQFYGYGATLPSAAAQTYAAGAGSIADQEDYAAGIKIGRYVGQGDAAKGAGEAWTGMADGGVVGSRDLVTMGGRPGKTIDLRKQYNEYRVEASSSPNPPKEWADWLQDQGYELTPDNLVQRKQYAAGGRVGGIGGPRTGITGVRGRAMMPKRGASRYRHGGEIIDGESRRVEPVDLETGDFIVPKHAVDYYGQDFWDKLVTDYGGDMATDGEARYAEGGGVGLGAGIRRGYALSPAPIVGNVVEGLRAGLLGAERTRLMDEELKDREQNRVYQSEDREYLRGEREYQTKQREKAETKMQYERDLDFATARFVRSDGTDIGSILDVYKKYSGDKGDVNVVPNPDGTFTFSESGATPQKLTREQLRAVGMNMIESMRDPKALIKSWNEKPTTVNTPYGGVTHAYDPRTRQWSPIADNNSDARAAQGAGRGRGADVLGWKDHNQMNDDIQRLAFKRFAVPNPNGVGSILDPEGQQKAGMFKNFVFAELDKIGKSPRELTSSELNAAAGLAEAAVDEQFRRRSAKRIKGAGGWWFSDSDAKKAAADMANYFPRGGSETEMRAFMAQRDITDKADQDQVLANMQAYQPAGGIGQPRPAMPAPAAQRPGATAGRSPDQVKADFKAGRITREQAVGELKKMGFQ